MAAVNFEDKIKAWAFPILLSVISFFLIVTFNKLDSVHSDIQAVKISIEVVKKEIDYSKATVSDHEQRLRGLEKSTPIDNTRVSYEAYNN
jgi:hypothetical protein